MYECSPTYKALVKDTSMHETRQKKEPQQTWILTALPVWRQGDWGLQSSNQFFGIFPNEWSSARSAPFFLASTLPYAKSFNTLLSPHFPFLYFSCLVPQRMEDEYNQPIQREDISASWQVKTHQMWAGRVMKGKALEQLAKSSVAANSIQWLPTSTKALFYMYSIFHWTLNAWIKAHVWALVIQDSAHSLVVFLGWRQIA